MYRKHWPAVAGLLVALCITRPAAAQEAAPPAVQPMSFSIADDLGILAEKGSSMARLLVYERLRLAMVFPLQDSALDIGLSGSFGSLLGSHRSAGLDGTWRFREKGSYTPSLGIGLELDFGDSIFYGGVGSLMPAVPMFYFGALAQPLAFTKNSWRWSVLDVSFSLGLSPVWPLRTRLGLFSLAWSPGCETDPVSEIHPASTQGVTKKSAPWSIGLSSGISLSISGNYLLQTQGFPSIRLEGGLGPGAVSLEAKAFEFSDYSYYSGFQFAGELLLCPANGQWQPEAGLGLIVAVLNEPADWFGSYMLSPVGVLRPLRFEFPVSGRLSWNVSILELRIGPVLANPLPGASDNGNFIAELGLVNIGFHFGRTRSDSK